MEYAVLVYCSNVCVQNPWHEQALRCLLLTSSPSLSPPRYSAFRSSKKKIKNDLTKTDLEQLIRDKNVSDVYVVGLATEVRYYEHVANPAAMGWFAQ